MGKFFKIINEAMPTSQGPATGKIETGAGLNPKPADEVKKGGFLNKVTSATQKAANFAKKGAAVSKGNWNINDALQKILDKQLDKSTNKVGLFGKDGYKTVKLGDDIITKINVYGQDAEQEPVEVEANESFLTKIEEAFAALDQDKKGRFKSIDKTSKKSQVWEVLKDVLELDTQFKLKDPDTGKNVVDRRVDWIAKGVPDFLKKVKEFYPDIPFTYEAHSKDDGLSAADVEKEQEEEFNFDQTSKDEWIKTLGEEKAEKIVRGLVDIYPGDRIEFNEPENTGDETEGEEPETEGEEPETEGEEPDGPAAQLTGENAIFELAGRTSFGEKGIQWTLKPQSNDIVNMFKDRDIKYLTYLLDSKDNEFKTLESNKGTIYAYDTNNQVINPITTESVSFQWNGQDKLYTLSTQNKELMGVKYSEGQFPIDKAAVKSLADGKHILWKPKEEEGYMKFKILQELPSTNQYLINKNKGDHATPEEVEEAEAISN